MSQDAYFIKFGVPTFGAYVFAIMFLERLFPFLICDDLFF